VNEMPAKWKPLYDKLLRGSWSQRDLEYIRDKVLDGSEPARLRWVLGEKLQQALAPISPPPEEE
jgi:hypothetical protein